MTEASLDHLCDDVLRALSLGQLTEAELARVSAHLGGCPECCGRIDQLAAADQLLARLQQKAASREAVLVTPAQRRSAVRALRQSREVRSATQKRQDAVPVLLPLPKQVGDYDILAEVGRGGMGVVYKAWHRSLHRLAALKMVLAGEFASPTQELRFQLEAELAARVRHPNIVQVYEIGSYEGRPFLALEWAEGGSLANRLEGKPWPPREAASLIETLARAIDVAHGEGVVHRDLKPANILLSTEDSQDKSAAGDLQAAVPKVADFGLAQMTEGGQTMTQSGLLVGTPGYMAPEQAGGKRAQVGPATDIYALGVVLYQLLTGQLPFERDSTLELLRAVTSDEPPRPRHLQPRVPRDLEAVTLHCLEKEPGRRYATALALAEDLRRFLNGEQVMARPVGAPARLVRACRRRPLVALLLGLLTVSLFGGLGGVTWKWLEADEQRNLANTEKQAALYLAYRASVAAASAALEKPDVADATRYLKAAPKALRGWEWRHLSNRLDDSSTLVPLLAGGQGFLIAAPDQLRVGILTETGLGITDLEGREQRTVPLGPEHRNGRVSVSWTRRGLRIAAWVDDTAFDLLDEAGQVLCRVVRPDTIKGQTDVVVSPDSTRLAFLTGEAYKQVAVFDAIRGELTARCKGHDQGVWPYTFSPDSKKLATGSADATARVWNAATGELLATCRGHASTVHSVTFSPDGTRLLTASADGTVMQWDAAKGQLVELPYDRHGALLYSAVYSPDGQWVASGGEDRIIRVWTARGRHEDVAVLQGHTGYVFEVAFAPDGRRLASRSSRIGGHVGYDDSVRVWDLDPEASLPVLRGHRGAIHPLAYSPDGRWLGSGSWDGTVRLWDAATGELCAILPHPSYVFGLAFGPDGTWLLTGDRFSGRLRVWDVATARVRKEIPFHGRTVLFYSLTVSPDGTRVAATVVGEGFKNHRMTVCDIATGEPLFSAEGAALAYSPDGRWLAVRAADEKTVLLLDARTHEKSARFSGHKSQVYKAAFSADSRYLASCSQDHTVRLWPIGGGECRVLSGHTDLVYAVAFHPDGTRLASAARDGAVWLWDVARGEEVVRLPGQKSFVWSLAFSKDGATLASGSGDGTVRLWDTAPLKTRYQARREAEALRPEAERLVERLWRQKNDQAEVVDAIRSDPGLSEPFRHAARLAALRQTIPAEKEK
jgi:WD40 repeat protein/tRNA A-37 threonylcarbamoyl transferase component Bud32